MIRSTTASSVRNATTFLFKQGETEKAIEYFQTAIKIREKWSPPYLKIGYAFLQEGHYKSAEENLKKFLELSPDDPEAPTVRSLLPQIEDLAKKQKK